MKKFLLPFAMLAMLAIPATANAEQCRNGKGQFAKCGSPGSMPDSQYQRKTGKAAPKAVKAAPAMKPAAMKPAAAPAMAPAAAKSGPCKDGNGKFIKCGTAPAPAMKPAAAPAMKPAVAPAMKPAAKPAPAAAAKAAPAPAAKSPKAAPCKNDKGKFVKCPK